MRNASGLLTVAFSLIAVTGFAAGPALAQDAAPAADVSQSSQGAPKFQTIASADSPGKVLHVDVMLSGDGNLSYQILRNGQVIVNPSRLGLILAELVKANDLQAKPDQVSAQVEEFAQSYEDPQQVIKYYFSDRNRLAEIEALVLEENVVNYVLGKAKVTEKSVAFDELMGNNAQA